jgi:hypothetical protein
MANGGSGVTLAVGFAVEAGVGLELGAGVGVGVGAGAGESVDVGVADDEDVAVAPATLEIAVAVGVAPEDAQPPTTAAKPIVRAMLRHRSSGPRECRLAASVVRLDILAPPRRSVPELPVGRVGQSAAAFWQRTKAPDASEHQWTGA